MACLFVVAAPFAVYFAVMVTLDQMHDWWLFVGAPMVLAGVLIGALLDRAYARAEKPRADKTPATEPPRATVPVTVAAPASGVARGARSIEGVRP